MGSMQDKHFTTMFLLKLLAAFSTLKVLLCQECGKDVDITPPTYTFTSPNYPDDYDNDKICSWKVSVEESLRIQLWFTDFEFDKRRNNRCNDFLEMRDGGNNEAHLLCKSCAESLSDFKNDCGITATFNSSGNMLFLKMTTNPSKARKGFSATFKSIPEPATTADTVVVSTSPEEESTILKRTTVDTKSPTTTVKPIPTNPTNNLKSVPTCLSTTILGNPSTTFHANFSDIPSLQTTPPPSSSFRIIFVVGPTISLVLLLACIYVTGAYIRGRSSKRKSKTSPNNLSIHGTGTNPVTVVKEQSEPYNTTLYYNNESFHASPQGTYPPPYQSKDDVNDIRSSSMNTRILPIEEGRNGDYTANVGEATNIAYESYDEEKFIDNGDYAGNVGEVGNTTYESYDGQENVNNGDYTANVGEVSNIAYQSYDGQGKIEKDAIVLHEGETSNVVYESYDRHENSSNSDDTAKGGEVSNVAYESYDGENNLAYDTDEVSREYQTIDDSQSVDDDYSKIRY